MCSTSLEDNTSLSCGMCVPNTKLAKGNHGWRTSDVYCAGQTSFHGSRLKGSAALKALRVESVNLAGDERPGLWIDRNLE